MLGLVGVVVAPVSVMATLPLVLAVPVLKTTTTTSTVGACAHMFGGLMEPMGTLVETTLMWCFLLNYLLPSLKSSAYSKGLPSENYSLTHMTAAQLYLGMMTLLVLLATHVLVTMTPKIPANRRLDVCPITSVFMTTVLVASIKLYANACMFLAMGSAMVGS